MCDLIDFVCGEWRVDKIQSIFDTRDKQLILATPLSKLWPKDIMFWRQSKEGEYTTKFNYSLAKLGQVNGDIMAVSRTYEEVWRVI